MLLLASASSVQAFDLQGHRGARGLAPENTLAAFKRALDIGVTTIETDLGITLDGVVAFVTIVGSTQHSPAGRTARGDGGRSVDSRALPCRAQTTTSAARSGECVCESWTQQVAAAANAFRR